MTLLIDSQLGSSIPGFQLVKSAKLSYPLSLDHIKRHLRLDNDFMDDDDYIMELLYSATQMTENYLNKDICKTLNTLRIDDFNDDFIQIMEGNFLSIDAVKNSSGVAVGSIKQTSAHYDYFTIEWDDAIEVDPLVITFYTGFEQESTPSLLKQAILISIGDFYDNARTSMVYSGLTDSKVWERILNQYQSIRF